MIPHTLISPPDRPISSSKSVALSPAWRIGPAADHRARTATTARSLVTGSASRTTPATSFTAFEVTAARDTSRSPESMGRWWRAARTRVATSNGGRTKHEKSFAEIRQGGRRAFAALKRSTKNVCNCIRRSLRLQISVGS